MRVMRTRESDARISRLFDDLSGVLPPPKMTSGKPWAERAVRVHLCEAEVGDGRGLKLRAKPGRGSTPPARNFSSNLNRFGNRHNQIICALVRPVTAILS